MTTEWRHGARCFGTEWRGDVPLQLFDPAPVAGPATGPATGGDRPIRVSLVASIPDRALVRVSPRMQLAPDGFRFRWNDEAVFDCFADGQINVLPQGDWRGALPESFFSTVAATMLAWRGMLPLHMSSVVINGCAWLYGGASGAGKSTLVAKELRAGALFLADDLSLLQVENGQLRVTRGRPTIRLYPSAAAGLESLQIQPLPQTGRGKLLVWPVQRAPDDSYPIGGIIMLGHQQPGTAADKIELLAQSVFRPKITARIPSAAGLRAALLDLARTASIRTMPAAS